MNNQIILNGFIGGGGEELSKPVNIQNEEVSENLAFYIAEKLKQYAKEHSVVQKKTNIKEGLLSSLLLKNVKMKIYLQEKQITPVTEEQRKTLSRELVGNLDIQVEWMLSPTNIMIYKPIIFKIGNIDLEELFRIEYLGRIVYIEITFDEN